MKILKLEKQKPIKKKKCVEKKGENIVNFKMVEFNTNTNQMLKMSNKE